VILASGSPRRREILEELGISPIEYKNRLRMEKARHLLLYTYNTVSEIAASLGFDSVYVFSRIFRQYNGLSPSSFRKNHAK
jgi:iron complex transport system substrate-binding protein